MHSRISLLELIVVVWGAPTSSIPISTFVEGSKSMQEIMIDKDKTPCGCLSKHYGARLLKGFYDQKQKCGTLLLPSGTVFCFL
jgi:hypothetical protein